MPHSSDDARQFLAAFDAELERIGLNRLDLPGLPRLFSHGGFFAESR
jgi:hypothetical protein